MTTNIQLTAENASKASLKLGSLSNSEKNDLLEQIKTSLKQRSNEIEQANKKDCDYAQDLVEKGEISQSLYNRLVLTSDKIDQLSIYVEQIQQLEDPVGKKQFGMRLDDGLELTRESCPIGVIAVIFEARPEVVVQVSALAIKSGNAVILKGGREANESNRILHQIMSDALSKSGLSSAVNLIETREEVADLLGLDEHIDLIIPRGSNSFVKYIQENSSIPVLGHSSGICHLYIDKEADPHMAVKLALDSKTDYPSACNAVETILYHKDFPGKSVKEMFKTLHQAKVELYGDNISKTIAGELDITCESPDNNQWDIEYSDMQVSLKQVHSLEDAIEHINRYGSHHTDSIITENQQTADQFIQFVDSGCVFHNASTRFSDGFVFGLGAEVGISTNKIHARGPVGLEGLLTYKYKLTGKGQVKADYSGVNAKPFLHKPI